MTGNSDLVRIVVLHGFVNGSKNIRSGSTDQLSLTFVHDK